MSAPAVVIVVALEALPRVYADAAHEGDLLRLDEWLCAHPELARLVRTAGELARKAA